jgi:signal transduction histidine kinase
MTTRLILLGCSVLITLAVTLLITYAPNVKRSFKVAFWGIFFGLSFWQINIYIADNISASFIEANNLIFIWPALAAYASSWFIYLLATKDQKTLPRITNPPSRYLIASTVLFLLQVLASLSQNIFVNVYKVGDETTLVRGTLYYFYILLIFASVTLALAKLYLLYRQKKDSSDKKAFTIIFLTVLISVVYAIAMNAVIPLATHSQALISLGVFTSVIYAFGFSLSIVRYKFLDIKLVVARSVAYILLLTTLAAIYAAAFLSLSRFFLRGNKTNAEQGIINVVLVVALAALFQPLKRFFQKITDSIFYRGGYDPQVLLSNLGAIMAREIELDRLTSNVITELTMQMKLSKAVIVVLDKGKVFYEANYASNNHITITAQDLEKIGSGVVIKDLLENTGTKEIFDKYDLNVCVDLRSTNELNGYLLLGGKKSGDIFNQTDIKALNILAHELAIALHNAKSYTQIQNFNKTLQERIDEATAQLRDANEHLKELDQLKNEFLSMATHQLNTPLTVVDGYLTLVNDGVVSEPAERRDYLEKTLERVRSMKRMVSDFLNISRIETGKFIIDVKPTDINKMVTEEVNNLGPSAKEKEVLLQFIPPKHPVPFAEIDEQKTRQAIMNLIDNAIYYTPKGEVKVYLEADKDFVTFKVVDHGIGVPEKQKNKLFQKFYRADNARNERPNGNGVGLFLVKRVAEDQGGKIIFESTEGKGSTFGFTLPIKSPLAGDSKPLESN